MTTWREKKLIAEEILSLRKHRLEMIAYGPAGQFCTCRICGQEYERGDAARDDCRGHSASCLIVKVTAALHAVRDLDTIEEHELFATGDA